MNMKTLKFVPLFVVISLFFGLHSGAQVAINDDGSPPHASAMLDVESTSLGLLVPRMTTGDRMTLAATASEGLVVFDTDLQSFYFYNGSAWEAASVGQLWSRSGSITHLSNQGDDVVVGSTNNIGDITIDRSNAPAFFVAKSGTGYAGLIIDKGDAADNGYLIYRTGGVGQWYAGMIGDNNFAISRSFTAPDGILYLESTGEVGIGTTTPERTLEVNGPWQTARISSTSSGATLEFVSTSANDWAVTTWSGNMALLHSTNDFSSKTDEFYFTTSSFYPWTDNTKTLGTSSKQWSNLYSIDGAFTGDVGVGIQSPLGRLQVHEADNSLGTLYVTSQSVNDSTRILFGEGSSATYGMYWMYDGYEDDMELFGKSGSNIYGPHIAIERNNGYVAIGSDDYATGYMLSVHGDVICEELRVELVADWPDYVFAEDYELMTIPQLESFIAEYGHLPNIPPAEEIEDAGFDVGEMQKLMMEKIEELSLYIIEQNKELEANSKILMEQQKEIENLKEQINKRK
jgi:hypothetical protein